MSLGRKNGLMWRQQQQQHKRSQLIWFAPEKRKVAEKRKVGVAVEASFQEPIFHLPSIVYWYLISEPCETSNHQHVNIEHNWQKYPCGASSLRDVHTPGVWYHIICTSIAYHTYEYLFAQIFHFSYHTYVRLFNTVSGTLPVLYTWYLVHVDY